MSPTAPAINSHHADAAASAAAGAPIGNTADTPADIPADATADVQAPVSSPVVSPVSVLTRFERSLGLATSHLSTVDVRREMQLVRHVQAMANARMLQLTARLHELSRAPESPWVAVDPATEMRTHAGLRSRDVRVLGTQTVAVEAAPELARLLVSGATTGSHVESVGRAIESAGPGRDTLLGQMPAIVHNAVTMRPDRFDRWMNTIVRDSQPDEGLSRFARQRRSTHLRIWNDADGMTHLRGAFDPERGAVLAGALDRRVEAMFHAGDAAVPIDVAAGIEPNDHRRALALASLCSDPSADRHAGRGPTSVDHDDDSGRRDAPTAAFPQRPARGEVIVHIDLDTLRHGLHEHSICRTSRGADIPPHTARRIACDADIIPIVLGGTGVPLDVGHAKRLATVHQRRALEAVHDTCAIDDCTVAFAHCTIHHLTPWEHGGSTDLANLVPLCSRHHHAAHEGGWTLRLDAASRRLTVALPPRGGP